MASVPSPIDAVQTPEWKALKEHHDRLEEEGISLKDWFAADPDRVNKLSFEAGDLHLDLSKNLITDETVKLLADLGRAVRVEERRDEMFSGRAAHRASPSREREGRAHRRRPGCRG